MSNILTSEQIVDIGTGGITTIINAGLKSPMAQHQQIVRVVPAKQIRETVLVYSGLSLMRPRSSGGPIQMDKDIQRYRQSYDPQHYSLSVGYDPIARDYDLYNFVGEQGPKLRDCSIETLNKMAADFLFAGLSSLTTPDGVALFGTHTRMSGATYVNKTTSAFSIAALKSAIAAVHSDVGERGIPLGYTEGLKLITGPGLVADASEILQSAGLANTANRADNVYLPKYVVNHVVCKWLNNAYVTNASDNWYLLPNKDADNPLALIEYRKPEVKADYVLNNDTFVFAINMTYQRAAFANMGTYAGDPS